jgi:mono/diheme cytochrome c family protein
MRRLYAAMIAAFFAPAAWAEPAAVEQFFERHCYACHSGTSPEAGLDLATLPRNLSDPVTLRRVVRIHDRIARREMPPADTGRPSDAEYDTAVRSLDEALFAADTARIARHGRARLRRLTASEYESTLRDVLGLERLDIRDMLPPDGSVAGYAKIADGLDLSPVHIAAYTAAADKALGAAIATRSSPPPTFSRRNYPAAAMDFFGNMLDYQAVLLTGTARDLLLPLPLAVEPTPLGLTTDEIQRRGKTLRKDRKGLLLERGIDKSTNAVGLLGHPNYGLGGSVALGVAPIYPGLYRLRLSLWAFQWNKGSIEPALASQALAIWGSENTQLQTGSRLVTIFSAPSFRPTVQEATVWLDPQEALVSDPVSLDPHRLQYVRQAGGHVMEYVGPGIAIDWYEFEGPLTPSWPPESHTRLFGDLPIAALPADATVVPPSRPHGVRQLLYHLPDLHNDLPSTERKPTLETVQSAAPEADARKLLSAFLPRAFRRPVTAAEVEPYVALVRLRLAANDCYEDAMRRAYVAVLTSTGFLFHPADDHRHLLTLADRLSYWLWNSPPDDVLVAVALDGSLADPSVLHAQVDRLLDDPRSERFINDFADQWLELRRMDETTPDRQLYPEYGLLLHEGVVAEPRAFLRDLIRDDLPVATLVSADFAMLTQRLAEHYGIPGVEGVQVRRVPLPPGSHRGGLLTQAAILKLTANGTTTSPVKRGVWVMDRLLDDPAPPPPPGISGVDPDTRGATTVREQLARHRSDSSCAACHAKIDPPGFALESFDPIGGYRDRYRSTGAGDPPLPDEINVLRVRYRLGPAVDPSGEFADGRSFASVDEMRRLLAADPRPLARAFTAHMVRYATGADISYADRRTIEQILDASESAEYGLRSIIHAIAASHFMPAAAAPSGP